MKNNRTKENRNLVTAHIGLLLVFALLSLVPFIPTEITGSSVLFFNVSDSNATDIQSRSSNQETNISTDVLAVFVNITDYSCSWDGINFTVCETAEWYNGSYAKGFISGTIPITQVEKQYNSTFTYCETTEKEGTKALHAYVYDANDKLRAKQVDKDVICEKNNITPVENVTQENITANLTENLTQDNTTNINTAEQENVAIQNITNVTEPANITEQANVTEEKVIQYQAVIGQPVKWKKIIKLENETTNLEVELPKGAKVLSVKEIENEVSIDITSNVVAPTPNLLTGLAILEEQNRTSLTIEQPVQEIEIEYETEAPQLSEEGISPASKIITVSSAIHYENILTFTSVTEAEQNEINLYMLVNGTKVPHEIINYTDSNNNGLIDQIYWITPHLSNQSFQIDLTILNVQSFPKIGGNWTVQFNTTGTANLTITPINGTTYWNGSAGDLQFLELTCGTTMLSPIFSSSSVFYQNYSCNFTGNHTTKVLTQGKHTLKFEFGGDVEYAYNLAGVCGGGTPCDCGDIVTANRTFAGDPISNLPCGGNGLDINTSGIEVDCSGANIVGSNTGVGINFSRDTNRSTIRNCNISLFDAGIHLEYNATNNYIINNNISQNDNVGINVTHEANGTNLTSNHVFKNLGDGIYISGYNVSSFSDTVHNNSLNAYHLYNTSACFIKSPFANESGSENGILFEFVNSTNLTDIAARGNNRSGIRLDNSSTGNRIELGSYEYNGLTGGLRNDFAGVEIDGNSTNNLIYNNTIQHNVRGLFVGKGRTSNNNSFLGNIFNNNSYAHVIFNNSFNNTARQQVFPATSIFSNSTAGDINFTRNATVNETGVSLINIINITNNRIFVNATNITGFNTTANIVLRGLTFSDARVLIEDNGDLTYRICSPPECNKLFYTGGRFGFNVTHFTQYQGGETLLSCGDLSLSNTFTANISQNGDCFNITGNNVVLDCDGFALLGNGTGIAINASNRDNITVKNCRIENFNMSIYFRKVSNATLLNSTILNSTWHSVQIVETSNSSQVSNTTIDNRGRLTNSFTANRVIPLIINGFNFTIAQSQMLANTSEALDIGGNGNITIIHSVITSNASEAILINVPSNRVLNDLIMNNTIVSNTSSAIFVTGSDYVPLHNVTITLNRIFTGNGAGVFISISSGNTVINNNITGNNSLGPASGYGINLDGYNTTIANNTINDYNSGSGIYMSTGENNTFKNNTIAVVNGAGFFNDGGGSVANNYFINNTITVINNSAIPPGSTILGSAIYLGGGQNNNFTNTRIFVNSTSNITWFITTDGGTGNIFNNTIFEVVGIGSIRIPRNVTVSERMTATLYNLNITKNKVFLNSSNLSFLNTTAEITIRNLSFTNPRPIIDTENDGSFRFCSECNETSYSGGVFVFNTTHFTLYSSEETNAAPQITRVDINSTDPTSNNTDQNITAYPRGVTDADGNRAVNITNWYKNGASITVLYLSLDTNHTDPSESNVIRDYSNLGGNGTATGGVPTLTYTNITSAKGGAYVYDGGGVSILTPADSDLAFTSNQNWTVTFWMNGTANGQATQDLIAHYNGSSTDQWELAYQASIAGNRTISFAVAGNESSGSTTLWAASNSVVANKLHFIIAMFEKINSSSGNMSLWVNGRASSSTTTVINLSARSMQLGIGGRPVNTRGFNGTLDEIIIFNQSLSAQQIEYLNSSTLDWLTIVSQETGSQGENWSACVTPDDGITDGNTSCSQNLTIGSSSPSCGDLSVSTTLTANVTSIGTCFNITADNVILDCAGYGITYGTVNQGNAVTADNRTNLVVQNCFMVDNSSTNALGIGINFTRTNLSSIYNNTIDTNGTTDNYGIQIKTNSFTNKVENNTIRTTGSGVSNFGINIITNTAGNNVTGNTINTNGTTDNYGIIIQTDASGITINRNNITTAGTGATNVGIYLFTRVNGTNITENRINTSGTGTNYGINLDTSVNNTIILNNTVASGGSSSDNIGINVITNSFRNNITQNRISNTSGTSNNYGIQLSTDVNLTIIDRNNVTATGTSSGNLGIYLLTRAGVNNITNNIIKTHSVDNNGYGIIMQTDSRNNIVDSNNISTNGTNANNYGIYLITRATANNITNNIINTSGTNANMGIRLEASTNDTIVLNNTINTGGGGTVNYGILSFDRSFRNNVTHNRIHSTGTSANYGIQFLNNADFSVAEYNNITTNGTTANNFGITVQTSERDNITNNVIATNGTSTNYGVQLSTDVNVTVVSSNNITTTGSAGSNFGIYVVSGATNNNITNNIINTSGTNTNIGINIDTSANNTLVLNNSISSGGSTTDNSGIVIIAKSFFNNITHNRIFGRGTQDNLGIDLRNNADFSVAEYNNITTNGTTISNFGVRVQTSWQNNITNNVIFTNGSSGNEGIRITLDVNNTVVDNNNITTTGSTTNNFGINLFTRNVGINITNNLINTSGTTSNHGIVLDTSANNTIVLNNSVFSGGSTSSNIGIIVATKSFNNNITHNRVLSRGTNDNYGVDLNSNINLTVVEYNNITTNGTTTKNIGIVVEATSGLNNLTNNVIFTNGSSSTFGIYILTDSRHNIVDNNNITTTGSAGSNSGIYLLTRATSNNVTNNIINTSGTSNNNGIELDTFANDSLILNNTIRSGGSAASNKGIRIVTTSYRNNLTNNVINTSGTATNYGIEFNTDADNNTVDRNNITTGGSSTANHGIYINLNSSNNNITNNIINSTGSGTVYGIAVENITEANSMNRFDSNNISVSSAGSFGILIRAANDTIFNNTYIRDVPNWTSSARGNNNNSFENTTFANINGTINFRSTFQFNGTQDITLALLNTTFNRSFVNSSNLTFLNTTATIRLYIPALNNPKMLFSPDNGSYIICPSSKCANISFANSVFTFNVTSWTSFAIANNTYPSITLVNPPNATINASKQHIFRASVSDVEGLFNATIYHNISGSFVANQTVLLNGTSNTTNFSVSRIVDGGYTWNVLVCDSDNLCAFASSNFTFTVETTAPSNITLINPPNATNNRSNIHKFIANITDDSALDNATLYHNISGSFVANQTVNLNGTNNQTNFTVNLIPDGGYTWYVSSCDTANNCNQSSVNFTFTVDTIAPAVNFSNPPNGTSNTSTSHTFLSNATDNHELANATLYHNINGTFTANETITRNGTENSSNFTIINIPIGTYIWNVLWCDQANNCAFASSNFTFTVEAVSSGAVGGGGNPAGAAARTQSIIIPKPKPVVLPLEIEQPKELPSAPRFRIPQEVIARTISLQLPLKFRVIDWTVLLIIASLIIIALISKQLQYLREYRAKTAELHRAKEVTKQKLKIKLHVFKDLTITLTRSVRILAISVESIFTALRFVFYAIKRRRLKATKLAALAKAHYVRSLEKAKRKLLERSMVEENLISLEELRRSRLARLHKLRNAHFDIRGRVEFIKARLLSTFKLTLKEMHKLEQSFRSQLPPAPELMPHPDVKEVLAYENDVTEFTYLYNKVDEYIKSNNLARAKEAYDALLLIYKKLLTGTVNIHEIISATKEIQSRLSLAILAAKAREKIEPYKPRKIKLEAEALTPEIKYNYAKPPTEEEIQIDYLHQLLKKNEYKKAVELFNSIYPEARKKPLAWPKKIKLPNVEKIKSPLHQKEIPRHEEDLRFSYMRELLRKNEYKEALKLYENIYQEKRQLIRKPAKLPDIKIAPLPDPIHYDYENAPSEEELSFDSLHRLLKKNDYKSAKKIYDKLFNKLPHENDK